MKKGLLSFFLGFLCFFVSQVFIRIPILENLVYKNVTLSLFQVQNTLSFGIIVALSAGLFEETFRFLFKNFILKDENKISSAILFGLGHSLMEIIYLFYPIIVSGRINLVSPLAIYERLVATLLHIELTLIIWYGFSIDKKYRYLFLAILMHSIVNSLIPIMSYLGLNIIILELVFGIIVLLVGIYVIKLKGGQNEKI